MRLILNKTFSFFGIAWHESFHAGAEVFNLPWGKIILQKSKEKSGHEIEAVVERGAVRRYPETGEAKQAFYRFLI